MDTLAALKPAFYNDAYSARFPQINWEITPGNSSPLSDGSAAVLITTSEVARRLGLRPLARIHSMTVVGSDPLYMLTGVIPATEKVLQRAGLTLSDIDLFEVNEAFAPVVLAWAARHRRRSARRPTSTAGRSRSAIRWARAAHGS